MNKVRHEYLGEVKGNNWVVGDIHGFVDTFKTLVQKIKLTTNDRLILLGDLVDRGPNVKGVFDYTNHLLKEGYDVRCIKGNHEDMMERAQHEEMENSRGLKRFMKRDVVKKNWFNLGGDSTMQSFGARRMIDIDPSYYEFIAGMQHYLEDDHFFYVHGGFDFKGDQTFTDTQSMMWTRDFRVDKEKAKGKKVIHGHTPLDLEFIQDVIKQPERDDFIALDNGVYLKMQGKGNLLAFETKSKQLLVQRALDIVP